MGRTFFAFRFHSPKIERPRIYIQVKSEILCSLSLSGTSDMFMAARMRESTSLAESNEHLPVAGLDTPDNTISAPYREVRGISCSHGARLNSR
jgi:hypothetical protein